MLTTEINIELFQHLTYNPTDIELYVKLWSHELDILDLTESERIELAKGWTYVTILYINNKKELEYEHYTYFEDIYTLIYKYVKIDQTHPINWDEVVPHILNECPHRQEMLGLLWVHRHSTEWQYMKDHGLDHIIQVVYNHRQRIQARGRLMANK